MKKITALFAFAALLALPIAATAGQGSDTGQRSDEIMSKIIKLDMMNFLLPLAMSKEQYKKVLPILEKIRRDTKKSEELEAKDLKAVEAEVDAAIKDCTDKGLVPKKELRDKLGQMLRGFAHRRDNIVKYNVETMYEALKDVWTPAQMKIAAGSLDPKDYMPAAKAEGLKDDDKIQIFVREIMLNPAAYEVMVQLSSGS